MERPTTGAADKPWMARGRLPLLLAAALLLTIASAGPGQFALDVALTRQVQRIDVPGLPAVVQAVNWLGSTPVVIATAAALALLLTCRGHHAEALLIAVSLLARIANPLLKALAASPRPSADLVHVTAASGPGFPSGHVMGTVLFFGCLIYLARRRGSFPGSRLVQVGAAIVIVAMGFSRVYVGAHWPSDVLGGYLWGAFFLLVLVSLFEARSKVVRPAGGKFAVMAYLDFIFHRYRELRLHLQPAGLFIEEVMMIGRRKSLVAVVLGLLLVLGAGAMVAVNASSDDDANEVAVAASTIDDGKELLPRAGITLEQAIAAAQTAADGAVGEVDLEYDHDRLVFNVDIGDHDVKVDAHDGTVIRADPED
jgi:undecaprenyl-diphosphatase